MKILFLLTGAAAGALFLQRPASPPAAEQHVGKLPDGGFLLNSGWTLRPEGSHVGVDTFPISQIVSKDGRYLLVLNAGYNPPSISVIDVQARKELGRTPVPDGWLGLTFNSKGDRVYVGGGSRGVVYEFTFKSATGSLSKGRELKTVSEGALPFIGDVQVGEDDRRLYAANLYNDQVDVLDLETGAVTGHWKTDRRPYRILVTPGGRRLFVSSWGSGTVDQLDAATGERISRTRVGPHATDMVLLSKPAPQEEGKSENIARLFVTASNTNNAYSFGVTKEGALTPLETINTSLTPLHPVGMTPSALALDPAGARLYIVCSDANAIAVADISEAQSRITGFIPTGWYPTAIASLPENSLAILNGKGLGSSANPNGPVPTEKNKPLYEGGPVVSPGYVGHTQTGTVAFLLAPSPEQISRMTEAVRRNSPYTDELAYGPIQDEQTAYFTNTSGHPSPIHHVIYIIKENRTYDQVLGDMEKGNGDKSLTLFGEKITPNLHRLAGDFVLYDNFYENADVSAEGHNWAAAAIAPDYTVKTWPSEYGHRKKNYDYEGGEPANTPPAGYLWTNALQAGISVRNYGEWAENIPLRSVIGQRQIAGLRDKTLLPVTDMNYRAFDLAYSDIDRAKEFLREWKGFDSQGKAPQILIVRLGNDHTQGTAAGALTPLAFNAQNDYAVGMIADGVSHTKLWGTTAIFIIEDDAQNGPDHVDSHRAPAWVISPFTRRGVVDSRMYNQTSVLRSIELIAGLRPMTHFDAAARPMFAAFSRQAVTTPYSAIEPTYSITERNPGQAAGSRESARMDFTHEDRIDDDELNSILWRSVKGTPPPAPVRSSFVR